MAATHTLDVFNNQVQHLFASFEREAARSFHYDHIHDPLYYTADVVASTESLSGKPSPVVGAQSSTGSIKPLDLLNSTSEHKPTTLHNDNANTNTNTHSTGKHVTLTSPAHSRTSSGTTTTLPRPDSKSNIFATPASPRLGSAGRTRSNSRTHSNSPRASPRTLNGSLRNIHSNFKVDVNEYSNKYVIVAILPSCKQEELHVSVADGMLTVSADRKPCEHEHSHAAEHATPPHSPQHRAQHADGGKHDGHSHSPKIMYGIKLKDQITQSLMLPADVDQSGVVVKHDKDALTIELPKVQSAIKSVPPTTSEIPVIPEEDAVTV